MSWQVYSHPTELLSCDMYGSGKFPQGKSNSNEATCKALCAQDSNCVAASTGFTEGGTVGSPVYPMGPWCQHYTKSDTKLIAPNHHNDLRSRMGQSTRIYKLHVKNNALGSLERVQNPQTVPHPNSRLAAKGDRAYHPNEKNKYCRPPPPPPTTQPPPPPPPTTQPPQPPPPPTTQPPQPPPPPTTQPPPPPLPPITTQPPPSTTQPPPLPPIPTFSPIVTIPPYETPAPIPPEDPITITPAPPGVTVPETDFNPIDQAYCIPLTKTDQPVEFCSQDFKGWGYDAATKGCILATCQHTFGARYGTKQDCEQACEDKINATPPPEPVRNDRLPIDYLVEPNVCVLINAYAWMKEASIQVLTVPLKGPPSVQSFQGGSMAQLFSISEAGDIKSLEGRTLRFQDSQIRFWKFKPYAVRDLGPLAYQLEQKERNLARSANQGLVTGVDADSYNLLGCWFIIPVGQM